MHPYLKLLRPEHYLKNCFVGAPLFFSGHELGKGILPTLGAIMAFCAMASAVYIFNDYHDIAEDRLHPEKKNRPLAAGRIPVPSAWRLAGLLSTMALGVGVCIDLGVAGVLLAYALLNVAYTVQLKKWPYLDITIIAIGFVLRLVAGSYASAANLSLWILGETFFLALFLALAKRRTEVLLYEQGVVTRKNIHHYTRKTVDIGLLFLSIALLLGYIWYCLTPEVMRRYGSEWVFVSAVFVAIGLLRYLQLALWQHTLKSPNSILLDDRIIQGAILGWIIFLGGLLYG
ncbi:UbiA prenyltransferase family protein [Flavobacterium sp.]|jgi:decaprenyl-phosphate phosphoribosyltransferase|uniref:UbiA prenyltransferase family protein n=1 Tax=Flavobacterium sp. TaxID=239 RepID=UPI0022BD139E|nr:UbiA prenyltransferase family protein [Flavobacterium sp.]MCZ8144823.1 UbiA prenyltransferase family protein [Flavobacterium sp.]MCZ8366739.1 UbiA prenyltransferase family protein [Flavobacterium sp.]